jgi:hypothetical protein
LPPTSNRIRCPHRPEYAALLPIVRARLSNAKLPFADELGQRSLILGRIRGVLDDGRGSGGGVRLMG